MSKGIEGLSKSGTLPNDFGARISPPKVVEEVATLSRASFSQRTPSSQTMLEPNIFKRLQGCWGTINDLKEDKIYGLLFPQRFKEKLPQVNVFDAKGRLYMGSYPGDLSEPIAKQKLTAILNDLNVTAFVSLLDQSERKKFTPYAEIAQKLAGDRAIKFLHFSIPDMWIAEDEALLGFFEKELLVEVERISKSQEALYIHCWGGHGRTGVLAAILIGLLYGLTGDEALAHIHKVHALRLDYFDRVSSSPYPSPQTDEQKAQVQRLLARIQAQITKL